MSSPPIYIKYYVTSFKSDNNFMQDMRRIIIQSLSNGEQILQNKKNRRKYQSSTTRDIYILLVNYRTIQEVPVLLEANRYISYPFHYLVLLKQNSRNNSNGYKKKKFVSPNKCLLFPLIYLDLFLPDLPYNNPDNKNWS